MGNEVIVTVLVENYKLRSASAQDHGLLQSPISPERLRTDGMTLVRADHGALKNEVTFKLPSDLIKLDTAPRSVYAHGIISGLQSSPINRVGDLVWLSEAASRDGNEQCHHQDTIIAVNLRTWQGIHVALSDVCWIPKYYRRICGEGVGGTEELLTVAGQPVMKRDKKFYILVVVQRMHLRDDIVEAGPVEVKEIVEQETWDYENLTQLKDGGKRIEELVQRIKTAQVPPVFLNGDDNEENGGSDQALPPASSAIDDLPEDVSLDIQILSQLLEGETDPYVKRGVEKLERAVLAKEAKRREPLLPPRPAEGVCNLFDNCPTPPRLFFEVNMPTVENLYPKHYHEEADNCLEGAAHGLHCVYQYREDPRGWTVIDRTCCILPPTVQHTCCRAVPAGPHNKVQRAPPGIIEVRPDDAVQRDARGQFTVVGGPGRDAVSDLPVRVREAELVPLWDLDQVGLRLFGYRDKVAFLESRGVRAAEAWLNGQDHAQGYVSPLLPGRGLGVVGWSSFALPLRGLGAAADESDAVGSTARPVVSGDDAVGSASRPIVLGDDDDDDDEAAEGEPDVFADRHFHGDEMFAYAHDHALRRWRC